MIRVGSVLNRSADCSSVRVVALALAVVENNVDASSLHWRTAKLARRIHWLTTKSHNSIHHQHDAQVSRLALANDQHYESDTPGESIR
jgi:hypothetical protein